MAGLTDAPPRTLECPTCHRVVPDDVVHRRCGVCRTCYDKFRAARVPLPPCARPGAPSAPLVVLFRAYVASLPDDARTALLEAAREVA